MTKQINPEIFNDMINHSENIVFFGGAGVSTESGIPDFRSQDGIYNSSHSYPPEMILSHSFFVSRTDEFYRFYKEKMIYLNSLPNACHRLLSIWEATGKLKGIITQNIDNLHQMAGSFNVIELHGSIYRNHCQKCGKFYDVAAVLYTTGIPKCDCGGIIKPDVVLYEETLDNDKIKSAIKLIEQADILIIGGTSLSVYPAAQLVNYYRGDKMILVNKNKSSFDRNADFVFYGPIADFFAKTAQIGQINHDS
ncbi:MAG: NAD-dependent protein deacylase [Candidatus Izemoplasmatales bacterium]|nr:NAD-dependent protein deacylase [Candidatus Izemoplasmatales bacterium]